MEGNKASVRTIWVTYSEIASVDVTVTASPEVIQRIVDANPIAPKDKTGE